MRWAKARGNVARFSHCAMRNSDHLSYILRPPVERDEPCCQISAKDLIVRRVDELILTTNKGAERAAAALRRMVKQRTPPDLNASAVLGVGSAALRLSFSRIERPFERLGLSH
jgi:hypothetical protein